MVIQPDVNSREPYESSGHNNVLYAYPTRVMLLNDVIVMGAVKAQHGAALDDHQCSY